MALHSRHNLSSVIHSVDKPHCHTTCSRWYPIPVLPISGFICYSLGGVVRRLSAEWTEKEKYIEAKKIAEEHWSYVERICKMMYLDGMIHGYGHGFEDATRSKK